MEVRTGEAVARGFPQFAGPDWGSIDTNSENYHSRSMIVIERFYSLGEAESARLELGFHGIESFIEHENTATLTPFLMSGRKSGIELKVSEEQADEAARILGEWKARHTAAAGNPPFVSYLFPAVIGAGLGLLLIKPLLVGLVVGAFIASVVITIFNHGINKGYDAARSEREDS